MKGIRTSQRQTHERPVKPHTLDRRETKRAIHDALYRSHGHYLTERGTRRLFEDFVSYYRELRGWSPVVALNYDAMARRKRWSEGSIHYCVDVERATKAVLANKPGLMTAWAHLVLGKEVAAEIEKRVVRSVSKRLLANCSKTLKCNGAARKTASQGEDGNIDPTYVIIGVRHRTRGSR